jgi:CDP-diacylglycerol---glycerol-3-phosphate 3-phosphatidyltransferase
MFELNLPNVLTVLRILLVPVLVAALLQEAGSGDALAAIVFALASVTDALDGWIARRRKVTSTFGKLMDPLADKLLVTAALVSLVQLNRVSAWVAMVIIAREFAVTGLRQLAMEHGQVIPASFWGKLKTIFQVAMVLVLIAVDNSPAWVDVLVWVTTAITVISGADYFFGFRALLAARRKASGHAVEPLPHRDVMR